MLEKKQKTNTTTTTTVAETAKSIKFGTLDIRKVTARSRKPENQTDRYSDSQTGAN
jgi:hypothetical protein